jgi:hypothetical protein
VTWRLELVSNITIEKGVGETDAAVKNTDQNQTLGIAFSGHHLIFGHLNYFRRDLIPGKNRIF